MAVIGIASGKTPQGSTAWQQYPGGAGVFVDINTSSAGFTALPQYYTSIGVTTSSLGHHGRDVDLQSDANGISRVREMGRRLTAHTSSGKLLRLAHQLARGRSVEVADRIAGWTSNNLQLRRRLPL